MMQESTWYEWANAHADAASYGALISVMDAVAMHLLEQAKLCEQQTQTLSDGSLYEQIQIEAWQRTSVALKNLVQDVQHDRARTIKTAMAAAASINVPEEELL